MDQNPPPSQQPDFRELAASVSSMARNMALIKNIPAISGTDAILAAIQGLRQDRQRDHEEIQGLRQDIHRDRQDRQRDREEMQGLRQDIQQIQGQMREMQQGFVGLREEMATMGLRIDAESYNNIARSANAKGSARNFQLHPLRTKFNQPIPNFPTTLGQLEKMTDRQLRTLLGHLDHPLAGNTDEKRDAIYKMIGSPRG